MRAIKDLGALLHRGNVLVEKLSMSIEIADQGCNPRRFHSWDGSGANAGRLTFCGQLLKQ